MIFDWFWHPDHKAPSNYTFIASSPYPVIRYLIDTAIPGDLAVSTVEENMRLMQTLNHAGIPRTGPNLRYIDL